MKTKTKILMGSLFLLAIACNQPQKQQSTSSSSDENAKEVISGDEVVACQHASKIYWTGTKPGGEHNGFIKLKEGNYIVEDDKLLGGTFVIDMNSIVDVDLEDEEMNAKLVGHLKSADFFDVDSFPTGEFSITAVEEIDVDGYNYSITGDLTLKAVTHPITFRANINIGEGKVAGKSENIVLDRTKWNVNYGSKSVFKELKDKFIDDEFTLQLDMHSM